MTSETFYVDIDCKESRRLQPETSYPVYSINTRNTYSVRINSSPQCACPYFMIKPKNRLQICEHIIWVYLTVLHQPEGSELLHQTALTVSELNISLLQITYHRIVYEKEIQRMCQRHPRKQQPIYYRSKVMQYLTHLRM